MLSNRYTVFHECVAQETKINERLKPKILSKEDREELTIKPIKTNKSESGSSTCRSVRSYNGLQILPSFEQSQPNFHSNDVQEKLSRIPIIQIQPGLSDDDEQ